MLKVNTKKITARNFFKKYGFRKIKSACSNRDDYYIRCCFDGNIYVSFLDSAMSTVILSLLPENNYSRRSRHHTLDVLFEMISSGDVIKEEDK